MVYENGNINGVIGGSSARALHISAHKYSVIQLTRPTHARARTPPRAASRAAETPIKHNATLSPTLIT